MKRNVFIATLCIFALFLACFVTFIVNDSAFAADKQKVYKWRMQSVDAPAMIGPSITQKAFCERVAKMSGGRLQIKLFTAGQLTPSKEIVDSLGSGAVDIAYTTGCYYTGEVPEASLEVPSLPPLLITSFGEAVQLYWYKGLDEIIREGYAEHGVYYLGSLIWEEPIAFWSKEPMEGVEDLKGYKPRSFGYVAKTLAKLGASPTFVPHEEVYLSLAQGIINGSMTAGSYYKRMKYYEVAPYYYLPGVDDVQAMCVLVSMESWNELPEDLQNVLSEAFIHFTLDHGHRLWWGHEEMLRDFDSLGATLIKWTDEDQATMRKAGLEFLPEIAAKNERCAKGIKMIVEYLMDTGYLSDEDIKTANLESLIQ